MIIIYIISDSLKKLVILVCLFIILSYFRLKYIYLIYLNSYFKISYISYKYNFTNL